MAKQPCDLLAQNGIGYVADWVNDDQPVAMTLDSGRKLARQIVVDTCETGH